MGQAKRRGTYEQRKAEAIKARDDELKKLDELWDKENPPKPVRTSRRTVQTLAIAAMIGSFSN